MRLPGPSGLHYQIALTPIPIRRILLPGYSGASCHSRAEIFRFHLGALVKLLHVHLAVAWKSGGALEIGGDM